GTARRRHIRAAQEESPRRDRPRRRSPVALFLDVLMHRPDMPIGPGAAPKVGLSVWNHPALTVILELLVYGAGILVYVRTTRPIDGTGSWALWSLVVLLAVIWAASAFGPPPPDERAVSLSGLALWLFIPWGYWIDRHRAIVTPLREA